MVQKSIGTLHGRLNAYRAAVGHMQLHNHTVALNQVQLLATDISKAVGTAAFAEGGQKKTLFVVINTVAHVVAGEGEANEDDDHTADHGGGQGGGHQLPYLVVPLSTEILGGDNAGNNNQGGSSIGDLLTGEGGDYSAYIPWMITIIVLSVVLIGCVVGSLIITGKPAAKPDDEDEPAEEAPETEEETE